MNFNSTILVVGLWSAPPNDGSGPPTASGVDRPAAAPTPARRAATKGREDAEASGGIRARNGFDASEPGEGCLDGEASDDGDAGDDGEASEIEQSDGHVDGHLVAGSTPHEDVVGDTIDAAPTAHDADRARERWWSLDVGLGPALAISDYGWAGQIGGNDPLTADYVGPAARLAAHIQRKRGAFFIGGGPVLTYSAWYFNEGVGNHWTALGAELLVGGGGRRVLVFGHAQAALGVSTFSLGRARGGGGEISVGFLPRLAAGVGVRGYLGQRGRVSLGALVDWVFITGVDTYLTLGVHFR